MSMVLNKSRLSITLLLAIAFTFSAACSKSGNTSSGPAAAAARAYFEAILKKDAASAKKYLSAGSIKKLESEAKDLNQPLDVAWRESVEKTSGGVMPDVSNEKISGDTATVDIKGPSITLTMPMVKEGGEWKMAIDKAFPGQRIFNGPSAGSSPAGSPAQTPAPTEDKEEEGDHEQDGHEEK